MRLTEDFRRMATVVLKAGPERADRLFLLHKSLTASLLAQKHLFATLQCNTFSKNDQKAGKMAQQNENPRSNLEPTLKNKIRCGGTPLSSQNWEVETGNAWGSLAVQQDLSTEHPGQG